MYEKATRFEQYLSNPNIYFELCWTLWLFLSKVGLHLSADAYTGQH